MEDRVGIVFIKGEGGPSAVPSGVAGELSDQEAGGGASGGWLFSDRGGVAAGMGDEAAKQAGDKQGAVD